jgi:AcrR family transcriptional regulator
LVTEAGHRQAVEADGSSGEPGSRPVRGRSERAILAATRELLAEGGVGKLTVEGVAARSGVAKTTIYRRWCSKDELALAVLFEMVEEIVSLPDLGDTRRELVTLLRRTLKILRSTLMGRIMQGLVSDLAAEPKLAEAFRERVVAYRVAELRRLVERGIKRGQLRPDTDVQLLHELLFGPIYHRLLLSGGALERSLAERIVAAVLPAFAPVERSRSRGGRRDRSRSPAAAVAGPPVARLRPRPLPKSS